MRRRSTRRQPRPARRDGGPAHRDPLERAIQHLRAPGPGPGRGARPGGAGFRETAIEEHASLVEGAWPADAAGAVPIDVAVSEEAATEMRAAVGDELQLTSRLDATWRSVSGSPASTTWTTRPIRSGGMTSSCWPGSASATATGRSVRCSRRGPTPCPRRHRQRRLHLARLPGLHGAGRGRDAPPCGAAPRATCTPRLQAGFPSYASRAPRSWDRSWRVPSARCWSAALASCC